MAGKRENNSHIDCGCPREKKIPVLELEFIKAQRTKAEGQGSMQMGSIDYSETKKQIANAKKREQIREREQKKKMKSEEAIQREEELYDDQLGDCSFHSRKVPPINVNATKLSELVDLSLEVLEPPLTTSLTSQELRNLKETPMQGWNEREASLKDFLSPEVSIEWSSSDEEFDPKSSKITSLTGVKLINLSKNKTPSLDFPKKLEKRNAESLNIKSQIDSVFNEGPCHRNSSESTGRLKLDSKRLDLLQTPVTKNFANSGEQHLPSSTLETPKKVRYDRKICFEKDLTVSPIIGSRRKIKPKRQLYEYSSPTKSPGNDINNIEPTSPILGSQYKQRTVYKFKCFDINLSTGINFTSKQLHDGAGNLKSQSEITQDVAETPSVKASITDENAKSILKRRKLSRGYTPERQKERLSKEKAKVEEKECSTTVKESSCVYNESQKKDAENNFMKRKTNLDVDNKSNNFKTCKAEERDHWNMRRNLQDHNLGERTSRSSFFKNYFLQHKEETCGGDKNCIEHNSSQNGNPVTKVADSQSDVEIDSISSPLKDTPSHNGTPSLESDNPSISCGSAPSPPPSTKEQQEVLKTGSAWLRTLQHTPEKPSMVKNLENVLIESPKSSLGASFLPRKYMCLKILKVGVPSNAALCKVIFCTPEIFQKGIKMENNKEGKHEEGENGSKGKYLVYFSLQEQKLTIALRVNDEVKVYCPWHTLGLQSHSTPVLFTSHFIMQEDQLMINKKQEMKDLYSFKNEENKRGTKSLLPSTNKSGTKWKRVLTTWTCSCTKDTAVLPSMCKTHLYAAARIRAPRVNIKLLRSLHTSFTDVKDTPEGAKRKTRVHPTWTILEAIEICAGISDVPVTITIRVHRIVSHRGTEGEITDWELVGQDAAGMFCTVKIPNRPLANKLTGLLEGEAYQAEVRSNKLIYPLLQDKASCPTQTYCYAFTVSLGFTELLHSGYEVVIPITLPYWSLQEALQVPCDGQRGNLSLHILYKVDSFLYVIDQSIKTEVIPHFQTHESKKEKGEKSEHEKKEVAEDNTDKEETVVGKVIVGDDTALPQGISESGTVMQSALVRDALIWNGNVIVDEYSLIQHQESKMSITLATLLKIVNPLSSNTQCDDLAVVSGTIMRVEEESAHHWPTCSSCKSDKVVEIQDGSVDCSACGQKSTVPGTGYNLELYQRTIEKLLQSVFSSNQQEELDAALLVGECIGPAVCVVQNSRKIKQTGFQIYTLLELPY
ncbi:DNA repair-scaffolding protein-like [Homarus americanus]|uniref:DNA repair-scaffolding protein-like n=3 Tax=Homarus americanus TaxID=6706 RepID=A0A8J5JKX1_HOMAM|nr:DNA repair-scaffolding protein-like [Homarus americanus]